GKTFQIFSAGLPQSHAYHLVYRHCLELAADRQTLAMASTTGGLWISTDAGEHWHTVSQDLPPIAALGFVP
ncbi:MAG: exo-alpha-sialidase, partial [Burkholderiaceae bacterium]|nr:exo-alpha-sialidase [Burkholderiaceae bacterium]